MNHSCCLAGRLFLPLLFLGSNVLAMDEREAATSSDSDWSIVSAPPPPGPYRSVNIDPRIPGQDDVSVPGLSQDFDTSSQLPAEALRMPPAAGGVAHESAMPGSLQPPGARDDTQPSRTEGYMPPTRPRDSVSAPVQPEYAQPPGPDYYAEPYRTEGYVPPPRPRDYVPAPQQQDYVTPPHTGGYAPRPQDYYAQPGRSRDYSSAPYPRDYGPAPQDFEQAPRSADYIPPPPGVQEDYARQPVPGPYGRDMQRPPSYNYPWPERYPRQQVQQDYRRPPPGYYSPSTQRPLQDAPQPPIYDSMMGRPSGGSAMEDASTGVPQ